MGERGVTISCTTEEFFTEKWHYTIIDAPGHRDFIKNMITGASQADVALIMVPADGNFTTAIAKGNHKAGEIQGQTRQHSRLINLLGVKQICIGGSPSSSGRWARRLAARRWRSLTLSSRTKWRSAASSHSSRSFATHSRTARASRALLSWTAMAW